MPNKTNQAPENIQKDAFEIMAQNCVRASRKTIPQMG